MVIVNKISSESQIPERHSPEPSVVKRLDRSEVVLTVKLGAVKTSALLCGAYIAANKRLAALRAVANVERVDLRNVGRPMTHSSACHFIPLRPVL